MNRKSVVLALALACGSVTLAGGVANAACTDPDLATIRDEILSQCPCTGNHGQHVSCVAHKVKDAVRDLRLDVNCKGKVVRCAARSTCGKKTGFVTCAICDPGTCSTEGFCDDGTTPCLDSTECPGVLVRCSTKSSEEACLARGGVVGSGSCCAAACPVPAP